MKAKTNQKYPASLQKVVFLLEFWRERLISTLKVHHGLYFRPSLVRRVIIVIRGTFENAATSLAWHPLSRAWASKEAMALRDHRPWVWRYV